MHLSVDARGFRAYCVGGSFRQDQGVLCMAARKGMSGVVRRICLWCQGKSWMRVRECAQVSCPLHACRLTEDGDDVKLDSCIREFCLSCAGSPEAVDECSADKPMGGQPACPAHPFRSGETACACQQPLQQVRLLPGLGDAHAQGKEPPTPPQADAQAPPAGQPRISPSATPTCPGALSITHAERAPEALDI
jgi:hypothetical protein